MAIWDRLTSGIAGLGIGAAAEDAISPVLETTKQRARGERAVRVVDPNTAATAEARDFGNGDTFESLDGDGRVIAQSSWGASTVNFEDDAKRGGVGHARFSLLHRLNQMVPGYAEALTLWRRGRISESTVDTILRREAIPRGLRPALKELVEERLGYADIANAIQQDFIPDPPPSHPDDPVLPLGEPPQPDWQHKDGPFTIPRKVVPIDSAREAKAAGINYERLRVLAELVGLPPGEETLLDMWRRGIIGASGYAQGLREGHTKSKWTTALSARFYQLLPAGVIVRLRLKGWIDDGELHDRMKLHGYRPEQADDWFHSEGRPATVHQALLGERRGGSYDGDKKGIPDWFQKAVLQSDIRNEWMNLLWYGRETYPSAFVLRRLVMDKALAPATASDILYKSGWHKDYADAAANAWAPATPAVADAHTGKAQTQLWTTTHRSYIADEIDDAAATSALAAAGVTTGAEGAVLTLWKHERELIRKQLTPAQIKKAYDKAAVNAATGARWTLNDAIAALVDRGYNVTDAQSYLNIPSGR